MNEADELKKTVADQKELVDKAMASIRKAVEDVLQDRKDQTESPTHH